MCGGRSKEAGEVSRREYSMNRVQYVSCAEGSGRRGLSREE